jgi:hypothetical protein
MGVFGCQLRPLRAPALQGQHDLRQLPARLGGLVGRARTVGLGTDLDDPSALQLPQPLGEQPPGQAGGTAGDLVEGLAADQDVANDDHGPALSQEL